MGRWIQLERDSDTLGWPCYVICGFLYPLFMSFAASPTMHMWVCAPILNGKVTTAYRRTVILGTRCIFTASVVTWGLLLFIILIIGLSKNGVHSCQARLGLGGKVVWLRTGRSFKIYPDRLKLLNGRVPLNNKIVWVKFTSHEPLVYVTCY